jgi:hypothetical protein
LSANWVYILSESDYDDLFYNFCLEAMTGQQYQLISQRLRRGGGISSVRRGIRYLLQQIKHTGRVENTFFVIALDNDRSPVHPHHARIPDSHKLPRKEQEQQCRFCEIERTVKQVLGEERQDWPIKGAFAVPVQMLESWLLLISNKEAYQHERELPVFAWKSQTSAQQYYAPNKPDDQLKDLKELEKAKANMISEEDFYLYCIEMLVAAELSEISPSFALFKEQVDLWHKK